MSARGFEHVRTLLERAVSTRTFPAAAAEVGSRRGPHWRTAVGRLSYDADAPPCAEDTLFDLASLTKVIVTTTVAMRTIDAKALSLEDTVAGVIPDWSGADRARVTLEDLLGHAAGLTAYLPLFVDHVGRADYQHTICSLPLEYVPRSRSLYSDLGFILLGFILEDAAGAPLAELWPTVARACGLPGLVCSPVLEWPGGIAPTEVDPWRGRLLVGDVHDENAWALGGVAGHAGLFGTVQGVGEFARAVLDTFHGEPRLASTGTVRRFARRGRVPGSSRALGWDTMLPSSSCGRHMSHQAIGHTGFTGTSLWVDPERDAYAVLLTNRVHPSRANDGILETRREFHDAVMRDWPHA